jgi:cytoskeletal protein CcmA (bactofilin family)
MFTRRRPPGESGGDRSHTAGQPQSHPPAMPILPRPARPDIPGFAGSRGEARETPSRDTASRDAGLRSAGPRSPAEPEGSKLIVGREIHLKGEITSCDVLVVEGRVEASMNSRYIRIAEGGVFEGDCEIDVADIAGNFNGNMLARERLVVRATGRVNGTIRYDRIEIEAGGEVTGNVDVMQSPQGYPAAVPPADQDVDPIADTPRPTALPAE